MRNSQDLIRIGHEMANLDIALQDLAFCYRVYTDFTEQGREPTKDMNAARAADQLLDAVRRLLKVSNR